MSHSVQEYASLVSGREEMHIFETQIKYFFVLYWLTLDNMTGLAMTVLAIIGLLKPFF